MHWTKIHRLLLVLALALSASLTVRPTTVFAHEGPSRLELNFDRLNPGVMVQVRGINLGADLPVVVALVGLGGEVQLGEASGDAHGDFTQSFTLPAYLESGDYIVRAISSDGTTVDAPLTISGVPALTGMEDGRERDERSGFSVPVDQALVTVPDVAPIQPLTPPSSAPNTSGMLELIMLSGMALAAIALAFIARRRAPASRKSSSFSNGE